MNLDALKERRQLINLSIAHNDEQRKALTGHLAEVDYWISELEKEAAKAQETEHKES